MTVRMLRELFLLSHRQILDQFIAANLSCFFLSRSRIFSKINSLQEVDSDPEVSATGPLHLRFRSLQSFTTWIFLHLQQERRTRPLLDYG